MKASGLRAMIQNRWNREQVYCQPEYWDAKANEYDGTAVSGWANQALNELYDQRELDIIHAHLPQLEGTRVLDIGCGTGRMARHLAAHGANVLGIDFSEKAVRIAEQQSPSGNPAYRVQTVFDLQADGEFDVALSLGCLAVACKDAEQLRAALARIFGTLKPGGKLLLIEPIHRGLLHFVLNMSAHEFVGVMGEVGFEVKELIPLHFWPVVRPMAYVNLPRAVTAAGHRLGEWLLRLVRHPYFGDYKAILALRPEK
jgi:2-polyprenyl-3-methyl-5-hydroxy-6-metoxy-1,4-benzoquinol methylase